MKVGILDVETTIFQKGSPYSDRNKLCVVGLRTDSVNNLYWIEYDEFFPYGVALKALQESINRINGLVVFNGKFDLHWLRRYSVDFSHCSVFDCQLAEFLLQNQTVAMPSLDGCAERLGLSPKLKVVEEEYWAKGIDTPDIPAHILQEYLEYDLVLTEQVYQKQKAELSSCGKQNLHKLLCQDLLVLREMEQNGIVFDWDKLSSRGKAVKAELQETEAKLAEFTGDYPVNFDSPDHVSALLYGGVCKVVESTPYEHTFKSGLRAGQTVTRFKHHVVEKTYPRLFEPLEGSELKKEDKWSTDEPTLRQLKTKKSTKPLIELLLKRAELSKLLDTYYEGLPKLVEEMDWKDGVVHGTFNQCVARTGRLSSSRPNQQNFVEELNEYIVSRY